MLPTLKRLGLLLEKETDLQLNGKNRTDANWNSFRRTRNEDTLFCLGKEKKM